MKWIRISHEIQAMMTILKLPPSENSVQNLSLECQHERLLQSFAHPAKEASCLGSINHTMVKGKRKRQHESRTKLAIAKGGLLVCAADTENGALRSIDDRSKTGASDCSDVRDRKCSAANL